jgi:hypothetical protein
MTQNELARRLKGDLDSIVLKALATEADDRYDSAASLGQDLRRYLRGEPVQARPDRLPYRVAKFVQRHQTAVAILAALSLLACAAMGYALTRSSGAGPVEAFQVAGVVLSPCGAAPRAAAGAPWSSRAARSVR